MTCDMIVYCGQYRRGVTSDFSREHCYGDGECNYQNTIEGACDGIKSDLDTQKEIMGDIKKDLDSLSENLDSLSELWDEFKEEAMEKVEEME